MKKLISLMLSACFLMTSIVHAEVSAETEMMKLVAVNLENGQFHFNQIDENQIKDMSLQKFEMKLDKTLKKIQTRNAKILSEGTADEIHQKYDKFKKTLLSNDHDSYWSNVFNDIEKESDGSYLPQKGWLKKLNSDEYRDKFKSELMEDVRSSGSVRGYYKDVKKKLKNLKKSDIDFPIEHVVLITMALMIIVGIFLMIFFPVGGVAFIVGIACAGTPVLFMLILIIRQLVDPITCEVGPKTYQKIAIA